VRWLGILVCGAAAWLLAGTPLSVAALAVAAANVAAVAAQLVLAKRGRGERLVIALGHLTTALGGFFLFVWLALR
jgi:hypothetical protein